MKENNWRIVISIIRFSPGIARLENNKKWRNTVRQTERIIMKELYEQLGISSQVYDFCHEIEESLKERFETV